MAKYQQYEEYKDSGVEWLGEIPKNWEVVRLKYIAELSGNKISGSENQYVGLENVESKTGKFKVTEGIVSEGVSNTFEKDNLLFGKLRPYLAKSWLASFSGICSSEFLVLNSQLVHPKFLKYMTLTDEFVEQVNSSTYGSKMPRASWDFIGLLQLPVMDYGVSEIIANFLDHETAQIDTLIENQQTLIQLLKEKRQAVISHAVTKGLNPDAPMKDSGVEWLGEVPEHWDVKRIKHYGRIIGGFAFKSDDFIDSGYPVLKISNVSHLQLNFDDESFLPPSFVERHLEYKVEENDLVFAMTRPIISGGIKIAKIPKLEAMPLVNQRVGFLKLKSELLADFILYSSLSSSFKAQFKNNMTITNQPNISSEGIESVALPMPPKNELVEIVDFLNNSETVFQNLSIKSEQQVELLKERRTALISAAVTGKIDVRGWQAPDIEVGT